MLVDKYPNSMLEELHYLIEMEIQPPLQDGRNYGHSVEKLNNNTQWKRYGRDYDVRIDDGHKMTTQSKRQKQYTKYDRPAKKAHYIRRD